MTAADIRAALSIDQLALRTGVPVEALRRHEDRGLIHARGRSPAGRRLFDEDTVWRVEIIRSLLAMGLSEAEIRRLGLANASCGKMIGPELATLLRCVQDHTRTRMRRLAHSSQEISYPHGRRRVRLAAVS
ncbi:MAG: MerR family transcriptional regulator [Mycobacteriaceae bacterium]|nr:MerR family transcriptional regulator [Mycobacteriaceae bacterium]